MVRYIIFLICFFLSIVVKAQLKNNKIIKMEYQHGFDMDSIYIPGDKFKFVQMCTSRIDSVISNGDIGFKKSKIGVIESCYFQFTIRKDTLKEVVIKTYDINNNMLLILQANKQFTKLKDSINENFIFMNWKKNIKSKEIIGQLKFDKKSNTSEFVLKPQ